MLGSKALNNRDVNFFRSSLYGLCSMVSEFSKKIGTYSDNCYLKISTDTVLVRNGGLYSKELRVVVNGNNGVYMIFNVIGSNLQLSSGRGIPEGEERRAEIVVKDCICNLSEYSVPIHSVKCLINHSIPNIAINKSWLCLGEYDIELV